MEHKELKKFPKYFMWGAATSAFQVEGAYLDNGKGLSIQDIKNGSNSFHDTSITSDHYHKYKEDIKLMNELGINSYRFSIAWTRIYPDGETLNVDGIKFYNNLIYELLSYNIKPLVTLYHFDHPNALQEKYGGWSNKKIIEDFIKFSKTCFKEFGDRVKHWLTICESNNIVLYPDLIGGVTGNLDVEEWRFNLHHIMAFANAEVMKLCHKLIPDAKIGPCVGYAVSYPESPNPLDVMASMNEDDFRTFYPLDLICKGKQNKIVLRFLEEKGFNFKLSNEELSSLKESKPDFIAFNYYQSDVAKYCPFESIEEQPEFNLEGIAGKMKYPKFPGLYEGAPNPNLKRNDWDWEIDPIGLRIAARRLYDRYDIPLMITENGLGAYDKLENGKIDDDYRINYLESHIEQIQKSITDGVEMIGYYPWSFIDLLSSSNGYEKRYGFVYVDRNDKDIKELKRYKKESFYWYQNIIRKNLNKE